MLALNESKCLNFVKQAVSVRRRKLTVCVTWKQTKTALNEPDTVSLKSVECHHPVATAPGSVLSGSHSLVQQRRKRSMIHLLCRNRVINFSKWNEVFTSHIQAHRDAGLHLVNLWRSMEEPNNNIFFLFEVQSLEKARAFINAPEAAQAGKESGVLDGEYHFIDSVEAYHAKAPQAGSH
jgi:hypothetical protein